MNVPKGRSEVAVRSEPEVEGKAGQRSAVNHRAERGGHPQPDEVLMHRYSGRLAKDAAEMGWRHAHFRGQAAKGQPLTEP